MSMYNSTSTNFGIIGENNKEDNYISIKAPYSNTENDLGRIVCGLIES